MTNVNLEKANVVISVVLIMLFFVLGTLVFGLFNFSIEEYNKFNTVYSQDQQCGMIGTQVLYQKEWDNEILSTFQSESFVELANERELLIEEQVNLFYECEVGMKGLVAEPQNMLSLLLHPEKAEQLFSKRSFLIAANDYNHQFLKLNEQYESKKAELERKAEIAEAIK